jgi:hypothetical protein
VGKFALIQHQRYAHAKQFKRANRMLKKLRTYLGRVIRDIARKIENSIALEAKFANLLQLARYTLAAVIPGMEALVGNTIARILSPTGDTAATMRRPITSSESSSPARSEA